MATRSNIIFNYGYTKIFFYRHYDGYLAETGKNLIEMLVDCKKPDKFIESVLEDKKYEITNGIHSDIEYLYEINFRFIYEPKIELSIRFVKRDNFNEEITNEVLEKQDFLTISQFKAAVNKEIKKTNLRIQDLNKHPKIEFLYFGPNGVQRMKGEKKCH